MSIRGFLLKIKNMINTIKKAKIEKLNDTFYDQYYTNCAKNYLNKILETYNREVQHSFEESLNSIKAIGLFEPHADSLNYLKNMRRVSMMKRK